MEIVEQIKEICIETDNEWFLTHEFTKLALCDLQLNEQLEKEENITIFNDYKCTCFTEATDECIKCFVETERNDEIDKLNLNKPYNNIYDYETGYYTKSKWIIPDKIEGKIPGFILLKCTGDITMFDDVNGSIFTHGIYFAYVRPEYRKQGILKNMVNQLPKDWNIWLEASSRDIKNVEDIWKKCGFQYHELINNQHIIYKKISAF
jgi:hypothetical protein